MTKPPCLATPLCVSGTFRVVNLFCVSLITALQPLLFIQSSLLWAWYLKIKLYHRGVLTVFKAVRYFDDMTSQKDKKKQVSFRYKQISVNKKQTKR